MCGDVEREFQAGICALTARNEGQRDERFARLDDADAPGVEAVSHGVKLIGIGIVGSNLQPSTGSRLLPFRCASRADKLGREAWTYTGWVTDALRHGDSTGGTPA